MVNGVFCGGAFTDNDRAYKPKLQEELVSICIKYTYYILTCDLNVNHNVGISGQHYDIFCYASYLLLHLYTMLRYIFAKPYNCEQLLHTGTFLCIDM